MLQSEKRQSAGRRLPFLPPKSPARGSTAWPPHLIISLSMSNRKEEEEIRAYRTPARFPFSLYTFGSTIGFSYSIIYGLDSQVEFRIHPPHNPLKMKKKKNPMQFLPFLTFPNE